MFKSLLSRLIPEQRIHALIYRMYARIQTLRVRENGFVFDVSHPRLFFRVRSFAQQEPEMLKWIDDQVNDGEVLFDVGANIGHVSLHAARRGAKVYAFEPDALTLASLNKNIQMNALDQRVKAIPIAASDIKGISDLYMRNFVPGNAYNTFGRNMDYRGNMFGAVFSQGAVGYTLDGCCSDLGLPMPHHVKIDVDGNEAKVIGGMDGILRSEHLKTVCIEITRAFSEHSKVIEDLKAHGFVEQGYLNAEREKVGTRNFYFKRMNS